MSDDLTLTMTAEPAVPGVHPPRVKLELLWASADTALVQRLDPDGRWQPVRTAEPAQITDGLWIGYDVEAPYGVDVAYRALAEVGGDEVDGLTPYVPAPAVGRFDVGGFAPATPGTPGFDTQTNPGQAIDPQPVVRLNVDAPWLIHIGSPSLSVPVRVNAVSPQTTPIRQGTFRPIGRRLPVVVSQVRDADAYTLTAKTVGQADRQAMTDLLADGSPLLWNVPPGWDLPTGYVSVGEVAREHWAGYGADPVKVWTLPLQLVDRPVGGQAQDWSWAALAAEQPSWSAVLAAYPTWRDVLAHTPSA